MYVIDTNFLGELTTTYPEDIFPSLWKELEMKLFVPGIYFHDEVHEEMKNWGHPRFAWYENLVRPSQRLSPDEAEILVYEEMTRWVSTEREPKYKPNAVNIFLDAADSWLVASAYRHKAKIVTNEKPAPNGKARVKIPDVAQHFDVECLEGIDFLRKLNISI